MWWIPSKSHIYAPKILSPKDLEVVKSQIYNWKTPLGQPGLQYSMIPITRCQTVMTSLTLLKIQLGKQNNLYLTLSDVSRL